MRADRPHGGFALFSVRETATHDRTTGVVARNAIYARDGGAPVRNVVVAGRAGPWGTWGPLVLLALSAMLGACEECGQIPPLPTLQLPHVRLIGTNQGGYPEQRPPSRPRFPRSGNSSGAGPAPRLPPAQAPRPISTSIHHLRDKTRPPREDPTDAVHITAIKPRNAQALWPEANSPIEGCVCDVAAGVPDDNAIVEIVPVKGVGLL